MKKPSKNLNKEWHNRKYIRLIEYIAGQESSQNYINPDDIYELAHLALGECGNNHQDWVEKWEKVYEQVKINL